MGRNDQRAGRHDPGIRVVKAFAQEQREIERFRAANDRVLQANDRVNTGSGRSSSRWSRC
jgi:ABC-type multidrug transport system fused ATPase/permease subunit